MENDGFSVLTVTLVKSEGLRMSLGCQGGSSVSLPLVLSSPDSHHEVAFPEGGKDSFHKFMFQ